MAVPLDAIRAIHNAFRKDITQMDESANGAAHGRADMDLVLRRHSFMNEILVLHAMGEEEYVFPVMETVAPLVSKPYEQDHRGLDSLHDWLNKAVGAGDPIEIARATAAFNFHLTIHLYKEDAHLYRIFNERVALPNQGEIVGKMAQKIPKERFAEFVGWLYPLLGADDRENMVRIMRQALPAPVFVEATQLIRAAIGNDWEDVVRRIPDLI